VRRNALKEVSIVLMAVCLGQRATVDGFELERGMQKHGGCRKQRTNAAAASGGKLQ